LKQSVEHENTKQENIFLRKQISDYTDAISFLHDEKQKLPTKDPDNKRYTDDIRTCGMELQGIDIATNKISNVIKGVSDNVFHKDVNVPSRTTIRNICDEDHVVAKQHVSDILKTTTNFDIFLMEQVEMGKKV